MEEEYSVGEQVWVKSEGIFYSAHIISVNHEITGDITYTVHYDGFSKKYNETHLASRLMKRNKENNAYARRVKMEAMRELRGQSGEQGFFLSTFLTSYTLTDDSDSDSDSDFDFDLRRKDPPVCEDSFFLYFFQHF